MANFFQFCIGALFAYVVAAPLTSRISMDLTQTAWLDLWTYVFLAFGVLIWFCIFAFGAIVVAGLIALFNR